MQMKDLFALFLVVVFFCLGKKATVTTKNGWLEDYSFLLGWLPGRCELLVSGRVAETLRYEKDELCGKFRFRNFC